MSNLSAALAHAAAGRAVFPCRRVASGKRTAKSPLTKRGFLDASTDAIQVTDWFSRWPDALIGLRTGEKFLVIDIDPTALEWFKNHRAELGARRIQKTARGYHLFYLPDDAIGIKTGALPHGVDVRGRGGYVIDHGAEGLPYEGADFSALGPLTTWARSLILDEPATRDAPPIERKRASLAQQFHTIATAAPGMHDSLRDLAAKFIAAGANPHFAKDALLAIAGGPNDERTQARLDEIDGLVDSAFTKFGRPKPQECTPGIKAATSIMKMDITPIKWAVRDFIAPGLTLLVASPKIGKSWLALQIGLAIASGSEVLGKETQAGAVLILALEDGDRRMQSRLFKLSADLLPESASDRLEFAYTWPRVDQGGIEHLESWLKQRADARLIVVDVLEKVRPPRNARGNGYSEDYQALLALKSLADRYGVSILVVHHTRKSAADDVMEMISGTQGLAGCADAALILKRPRGEEKGELHITGRDLPNEGQYAVSFSKATCRWELIGELSSARVTSESNQLLEILSGGVTLTPSEIAAEIGKSRPNVAKMLRKMRENGLVIKVGYGRYALRAADADDAGGANALA